MYQIGDKVRVLAPFDACFPGTHTVTAIIHSADGTIAYILGDAGGYDAIFLERAP